MSKKLDQPMKRYMPGIDGLRAISVLAVIAYHFDLKWAQGGLLGVGVFFVLSGYLITDQLFMEWRVKKHISIWNFWISRFRRLLPAMLSMLILVAMWLAATDPARLLSLKGDFISSVFYVNNWYLIYHKVSYFESFGPASPIGHLWSLSIEEQFYVIWPIALSIGIRFAPRRGKLLLYMLVVASVSAIAMALIYVPGTDPSRVYYGTDTRAFALLIGAAMAVGWPSWKLSEKISPAARTSLDMIGALGLLVLLISILRTNEYEDSLYQYGFLYLSLVTAVIVAVLAHPGSRLGKILGCRPLTWLGKHSYSLYIWHYPVITLMRPDERNEGLGFTEIVLQLAIIFLLSILSYKYIEEPIRRGGLRDTWKLIRSHARFKPIVGLSVTLFVFFFTHTWISNVVKDQSDLAQPVGIQNTVQNNRPAISDANQKLKQDDEIVESPHAGEGITLIGDSLTLSVDSYVKELLPGIVVDGKVGRQMSQVQEVVDNLQSKGQLGDHIIIELGSNGVFNKSKLRSLLDSLQDKELYLVTTRVSKSWQNTVNDALKEVANDYQNVRIIDWYSASQNKSEFFTQDGVHLTLEGARFYASLLAEQLKQNE
ncbi:acetyltransferase [Paenibacillus sp. 1011MAR3C5]|uniref:acyltransferase family protein n=1 Tax=Paenibacillus sp. 1011MAR3C5 TaxID=1675787 RepID=UPI000E6BCBCD|nr:acyltransferase family protein [Paenibacillus sp. 1011MAR3C5]RJE87777.1 acetyltransferase [Paenibacillus sp. 1011MAR3C5]